MFGSCFVYIWNVGCLSGLLLCVCLYELMIICMVDMVIMVIIIFIMVFVL